MFSVWNSRGAGSAQRRGSNQALKESRGWARQRGEMRVCLVLLGPQRTQRQEGIGRDGESGPAVTAVDGADAGLLVVLRGVQRVGALSTLWS